MIPAPVFNTTWLNKTENKTPKTPAMRYLATIWHETQNASGVAENTLRWNIPAVVGSSYDFLIARNGTIFQYLDYHLWCSWDSGESEWTIDGKLYTNWDLNRRTLGIELDGPCDGTPVTAAQVDAAARLAIFLSQSEGIPLDRGHQLTHAEVAAKRTSNKRTDPRGYTPEQVLARARQILEPDWRALWGTHAPYHADYGIPAHWRLEHQRGKHLGPAMTDELAIGDGRVYQVFDRGVIVWSPTKVEVWR